MILSACDELTSFSFTFPDIKCYHACKRFWYAPYMQIPMQFHRSELLLLDTSGLQCM